MAWMSGNCYTFFVACHRNSNPGFKGVPGVQFNRCPQDINEQQLVVIIDNDRITAPVHNMVPGIWIVDSQWFGHDLFLLYQQT